jgi:hypothetical protein
MYARLLLLLLVGLLTACSIFQDVPAFTGTSVSEMPVRLKSFSYPAYRKGVPLMTGQK